MKSKIHLVNQKTNSLIPKFNFEPLNYDYNLHFELLSAFVKANIPIHKLNNPHLKRFIQKIGKFKLKDESPYRKTLLDDIFK